MAEDILNHYAKTDVIALARDLDRHNNSHPDKKILDWLEKNDVWWDPSIRKLKIWEGEGVFGESLRDCVEKANKQ